MSQSQSQNINNNRLQNTRRRTIFLLWQDITEIYLGPARNWPVQIRTLFWSRNVTYFDKYRLCIFVNINPLPIEVFLNGAN